MDRLKLSILTSLITLVIPLCFVPEKFLSIPFIFTLFFIFALNYTQPELEKKEAVENKSSDKGSVALIIISAILSVLLPVLDWAFISENEFPSLLIIGIVLNLGGLILRYISIKTLGKHFTATVQIIDNHQLIKTGPYSVLRHPSYTGAFLSMLSISLVFSSCISLLISFFLLVVAYYYRIKKEEIALTKFFGQNYIDYSKNTFKLIPFIW